MNNNKWKKTIDTSNSKYKVRINYTRHADGSVLLNGILIDNQTGLPVDRAKRKRRMASNMLDIPTKETHVINLLLKSVSDPKKHVNTNSVVNANNSIMAQALTLLEDKNDPISTDWMESTREKHLTYFRRQILPRLIPFETASFTDLDRQKLEEDLRAEILSGNRSTQRADTVRKTVNSNLAAANKIYQAMRAEVPVLPEIVLHIGQRIRTASPESAKSLSPDVRAKLIQKIPDLIQDNPVFALRLILMLTCGLRDAEACAVQYSDFVFGNQYAILRVWYQVKEKQRCEILKTSNSYRLVVVPIWPMIMILNCFLEYKIRTGEDDIPVTYEVSKFSAWAQDILQKCGCGKEILRAVSILMDHHPDAGDGLLNLSVTSYILRREYASRGKNICGLTNDEIDAVLGHKRIKGARRISIDLSRKEDQIALAEKLERFVYNPNISYNPGCFPIAPEPEKKYRMIPHNLIRIRNYSNQPMKLDIVVKTCEPGESIRILCDENSTVQAKANRVPFQPSERTVIGNGLQMIPYYP